MTVFYNEHDKGAAAWLRELIAGGHIAPGVVDERDIRDIRPDELSGYRQCHFFAGIGGWSLALRLAGWADDRHVWTGSCPCQPFSAAGKRGGIDDERHLWPHWFHLIAQCRPAIIFGEQVASKDGLGWLDLVSADLEGSGYAIGAADLCAAGVGAPHIRQRLWFGAIRMADTSSSGLFSSALGGVCRGEEGARSRDAEPQRSRSVVGLADAERSELGEVSVQGLREVQGAEGCRTATKPTGSGGDCGSGTADRFWRDADWLFCRDGKWRPVEPGTFPLAHGLSGRVGLLRGYGNAISPVAAAAFIEGFSDSLIPLSDSDKVGQSDGHPPAATLNTGKSEG